MLWRSPIKYFDQSSQDEIASRSKRRAVFIEDERTSVFFSFCKYLIEAGIRNGLDPEIYKKISDRYYDWGRGNY